MSKTFGKSLCIYVSGPYSPPTEVTDPIRQAEIIEKNTEIANETALEIVKKGHAPFVPHTMMRGWEDIHGVSRERVLEVCFEWVEKCDALFFIAPSAGAIAEQKIAQGLNLPIYYDLAELKGAGRSG